MLVLGGILVPAGGVLFARFFLDRETIDVPALYAPGAKAFSIPGIVAWLSGSAVYYLTTGIGATLPSLLTSILVYLGMRRASA
jgi:purine-cytosine permease-like protein